MMKDLQGNSLAGATVESAGYYDQAVASFNIYSGDPIGLIDRAIEASPDFTMAHIFKASLLGLATEPGLNEQSRAILAQLKNKNLNDREASHLNALNLMLEGRWTPAAQAMDRHNSRYPRDILALQTGHLMDFYSANSRNLRDRMARVLPHWPTDLPGYSIVLGMYAFGLEESGDYARAEAFGRQATDLQPLDAWAHHAVAHVLEMQGRANDGIQWMAARQPHWSGEDNFFKVHNWWHWALCYLELGQHTEALDIYDKHIHAGHGAVAQVLLDASAMLWRFHLAGIDAGNRWREVAEGWQTHADGQSYPFNDWHAAMAYLGAGQDSNVEAILRNFRNTCASDSEMGRWIRQTALPLVEGFAAFWRNDYPAAVRQLHGARYIVNSFGGSHAQRDIIDLTLLEAAVRAGQHDFAQALAHERLALKPDSYLNRRYLARSSA